TDDQLKEMEAIILSMTPAERERPESIDGSRRRRIARGAGTDIAAVNRLLKGFQQMQQMMKQMGKGKHIRGLPIDPAQLLRSWRRVLVVRKNSTATHRGEKAPVLSTAGGRHALATRRQAHRAPWHLRPDDRSRQAQHRPGN